VADNDGPFARSTAVRRRGGGDAAARTTGTDATPGTTVYDTMIVDGWDIGGNANGGYLLAIVGRAMADHLGRPDPVTVTAHYLSPGQPGDATVEVTTIREGRRFATARADLVMGGTVITTLGTFGDLSDGEGALRVDAAPPALPPVQECTAMDDREGFPPSFMDRVDLRLHPDDAGFARGEPSGEARVRGWFRFPGDEPVDTTGLLCVLDAFPPTVFNAELPVAWVPTIEFTAHVRARPAPGWLACEFTTRFVTGGFLEEDGVVWDATGTLVAQSRQLALVPRAG